MARKRIMKDKVFNPYKLKEQRAAKAESEEEKVKPKTRLKSTKDGGKAKG